MADHRHRKNRPRRRGGRSSGYQYLQQQLADPQGAKRLIHMEPHVSHNKFKVFSGPLSADNSIEAIAAEVIAFGKTVAAKSIGVEYLEAHRRLVISLGYRDDEPAYPVRLFLAFLGDAVVAEGTDFTALEAEMGKAVRNVEDVICHELFITENDYFYMIILARGAA